ncbi:UDP-N-acetylmuramate dehydrogenase [Leptobacterium sp. I13]|uniref:UDP-N-acetylmuramate dehydrogenase n=1 Tax=Leptobacterium meishanense TaxID=3128904 RepID=UPI0030ED3FDE
MNIQHNISLKPFNTFGINVTAKHYTVVSNIDELIKALSLREYSQKFILGGGSNMLLTKDIEALVIHVNIRGIQVVKEDDKYVYVKAYAGENWHDFVLWTLNHNYGGVENLSLIPGNIGAAPIQNIGAYGVELKDVFVSCEAVEINTQKTRTFSAEACQFGYRNSIFKSKLKEQYIIASITLKLTKTNHSINTAYGAIKEQLSDWGITSPTIQDVSKAVITIRESKLPNPKELGNSGSFFKNPVINKQVFDTLIKKYPDIPHYTISTDKIKIPAGWLIEKAGYKGKRYGDAGVHKKQALVLINYENATGNELLQLAEDIQQAIKIAFDIDLEPEVNIF